MVRLTDMDWCTSLLLSLLIHSSVAYSGVKTARYPNKSSDVKSYPSSYPGDYSEPLCSKGCANGGRCIAHNVCQCAPGFSGDVCQFRDQNCQGPPPTPNNSQKLCTHEKCTINCREGYELPDGSIQVNTTCRRGTWIIENKPWKVLPNCAPTCSPKCLNNGNCIGHNTCQCPKNFRGSHCEYSVDECDPKKLGFNGNYECSGDAEVFTCTVRCPEGMVPQSQVAKEYFCRYDTGIFKPGKPPSCVYGNQNAQMGTDVEIIDMNKVEHQKKKTEKPRGGTCYMWSKEHMKLLAGSVVSFKSDCTFSLLADSDNMFKILTPSTKLNCDNTKTSCSQIDFYYNNKKYSLTTDVSGHPVLKDDKKITYAPAKLPGIRLDLGSETVSSSLLSGGVTLLWNYQRDSVEIKVSEKMWNRTSGLCGNIAKNELKSKSLKEFISLARVDSMNDICTENIDDKSPCSDSLSEQTAHKFCSKLLFGKQFGQCRRVVDAKPYYDACLWEYCSCSNKKNCGCESMAYYVKESIANGASIPSWRDQATCPLECSGGRIYSSCGYERTCSGESQSSCFEGCFCPEGSYLDNDVCVSKDQCSCLLRGKKYPAGQAVPKECNTCTCLNGEWSCTKLECPAQCHIVGDPHYTTFDRKTYDFMGKCSYYLVKMQNYSIEAENVPCEGTISQNMGYPISSQSSMPACTKSVTINMGKTVLKLKQGKEVDVNGEDHSVPLALSHAYVRHASSIYLQVILSDGVEVWWDGITTVFVNAPPTLKGKTQGLCGTFTGSQKDDFLTPEGDVEHDPISFANKWKTKETCDDRVSENTPNPCDSNPQNRKEAEQLCSHLTSNLFAYCHPFVDPSKYYTNCLYDVCSCSSGPSNCLCPIIASYSKECTYQGVVVQWRDKVRQCGLSCPRGQVYSVCSDSCKLSCSDLSSSTCPKGGQCLEGCVCPEGTALDRSGKCIPISKCPCEFKGYQYPPGHKDIRRSAKGFQLCTCINALWSCEAATVEQLTQFPNNTAESLTCSSKKNQVYTNCEPSQPITCQNMHRRENIEAVSETVCYGGCICKKGYVLDALTKECVKPELCPCHHGGRSYPDGEKIQQDCNLCSCQGGKWNCTQEECFGSCTGWGDSHFKTFDGKIYDFQGSCEYAFSKGSLSPTETFIIIVEMVPCGSSGVSCSKSVSLNVGNGDSMESVVFSDSKATHNKKGDQRIYLREAGLFIFADVPDLGLVMQWDKGTRVSARLDPKWKNRVRGLCGNFNDDSEDDFQTPSGGITEASADYFCDSWKLHDYCPEAKTITDTCALHPVRRNWAVEKCSILKSSMFRRCHSEVPVDPYLERCIFDTCGCDEGGDCECLCTAIAAYSQECNEHGVPITWRSQSLCPIQCDQRCSEYSACVPTCPIETCDNALQITSKMCLKDTCIEGCEVKLCPDGQMYSNLTNPVCVPKSSCKPVCLIIDSITYYEGDVIEQDNCHSCYCSRGKKVCSGEACTPSTAPTTTVTVRPRVDLGNDGPFKCRQGWSQWFDRDMPNSKKNDDHEPLPLPDEFNKMSYFNGKTLVKLGRCEAPDMSKIECRTSDSKDDIKEFGEDVECSLEKGLICVNGCHNYEIRVFCQCGEIAKVPTTIIAEVVTDEPETSEEIARSLHNLCSLTKPMKEHETDCSKFYQCQVTREGNRWIERDCSPATFFNPQSGLCEWPQIVAMVKPSCMVNETRFEEVTTMLPYDYQKGCLEGEVWDECFIQCDQLCHYYEQIVLKNGVCKIGKNCSPGCKPKERIRCPSYKKWRDAQTCVEETDCICRSKTGKLVKPGETFKEGPCEICQCISNMYICDRSECDSGLVIQQYNVSTKVTAAPTTVYVTTKKSIVVTSEVATVTPPPRCDSNNFTPLGPFSDSSYSASSVDGNNFPQHSKFGTDGVWKPLLNDEDHYLQIDLVKPDNVYAIIVKALPGTDEFVTKFRVLHSLDNVNYKYVLFFGTPELFSGPINSYEEALRTFAVPVEARYIRVVPSEWVGRIAMQVELQGCNHEPLIIQLPPTTPQPVRPVCSDLMSKDMSSKQISASSSLLTPKLTAKDVSLDSSTGWIPALNAPNEYLQFDFTDVRTLTGIKTKGSGKELSVVDNYSSWVSAFNIHFSIDGISWSPLTYKSTLPETFPGNSNDQSVQVNIFKQPVRARYVRVIPIKWYKRIALRAEILGCYEPYPEVEITTVVPEPPKSCKVCAGASEPSSCCSDNLWWDGEQCTQRTQCPCFVGFISYNVGATFENENCERCVCGLNGVLKCTPAKCVSCDQGKVSKRDIGTCKCECLSCPTGQRVCPSSNVCIDNSQWCDGTVDCPDDEIDCITTTTPKLEEKKDLCPPVECPPNFYANITQVEPTEVVSETPAWSPFGSASKWNTYFNRPRTKTNYGGGGGAGGYKTKKGTYNFKKHGYAPKPVKIVDQKICPQYNCIPVKGVVVVNECPPKPACQEGYELQTGLGKETNCDTYSCIAKKIKYPDGRCNITGRTFTTFDGTEFKLDICDHILLRDKDGLFEVKEIKKCNYIGPCEMTLVIKIGNDTLKMRSDLSVELNDYNYTVPQLQKIGAQSEMFAIKQISDNYLLFSSIYEFSIIWDTFGSVKIIVPGTSRGQIIGLCGYFDGTPENDKMKPDGSLAKTSAEFSESWGSTETCEIRVCPVHIQEKAYKACNALREEPLSKCTSVTELDRLISQCVETMCDCLERNGTHCHCDALLHAVTECRSKAPSMDLSGWRILNDCPVDCPDGQVYKECFRRTCEPCCSELMVPDACPIVDECFPGCYCPEGLVRDGDRCVKPSDCRDCLCEGYDLSRFVSFDRNDFRFSSNCTYVLAQTMPNAKGPSFKIFGTYRLCDDGSGEICISSVTVFITDHIAHVSSKYGKLEVELDGEPLKSLSWKSPWVNVHETTGSSVLVCLVKLELDLEFYVKGKGFSLKIPSHYYYDRTEGLCGNCNLNPMDDFKTSAGEINTEVSVFGESWRVHDLPDVIGKNEGVCKIAEKVVECTPPPVYLDPCLKLYEVDLFGRCHAVVNPNPYVENCHLALCKEEVSICQYLESYVRECQAEGICLNWRSKDLCPYYCPKELEYNYCTLGCTLTCDNYKLYDEDPSACKTPLRESCVCPKGMVFKNDICVNATRCEPCDSEGHYPGDKWQPDVCTDCECSVGGGVHCSKKQCGNPLPCPVGEKRTLIKATGKQCCPSYICVPEPTTGPECPEPQQPVCGYGQEIRVETDSQGCQQFTCRCKAAEDCDDVSTALEAEQEPGMVATLDESGCCPRVEIACSVKACPKPPVCKPFYEPKVKETTKCCPLYSCQLPPGKCLYDMTYEESKNGGEQQRSSKIQLLKDVGDTWFDGPCRSCECKENSNGLPSATCSKKVCGVPPVSESYIYEPKYVNMKCCPIYTRTACKVNGKVYQANESWPDPDGDPCKSYTCTASKSGVKSLLEEISIKEAVETCKTDCPLGWHYESSHGLGICCGACKQIACIDRGTVHDKDTTWTSADGCTNFTCEALGDQLQVVTYPASCPDISSCPQDRILQDGCCKKCNISTIPDLDHSLCSAESVALNKTVKIVYIKDRQHGDCYNLDPIKGFSRCTGSCESYSKLDEGSGTWQTKCNCCEGTRFDVLPIRLDCSDGFSFYKDLKIPSACSCSPHECRSEKVPAGRAVFHMIG